MIGTWYNMFGIQGLQISNVEVAVGFNPESCLSDFCLSALGLGYNITMGSRLISFYGYSELPEVEDVFLEGEKYPRPWWKDPQLGYSTSIDVLFDVGNTPDQNFL